MGARLAALAIAGLLVGSLHGCDSTASSGQDAAVDGARTDGRTDADADAGGAPDGPVDALPSTDHRSDQPTGGGDASGEAGPVDAGPIDSGPIDSGPVDSGPVDSGPVDSGPVDSRTCTVQAVVLARGGTTSACSFMVSSSVPRDQVNLSIGGRLCRQGSNNCTARGGWFWFGDEVALCDDTCLAWEASGANLLLEVGCPSESCFVPCHQAGGRCGDGVNSCCAGWRCSSGTCAACARGGQSCTATSECCSGSCTNGSCIDGIGGTCASQAGCSKGECRDGRCQCAVDQILCTNGCVSYTDPNNCRGCGNVCATGTGRVCTADGCVCDPQSAFPDECNGACVNRSNDRTNCGFCFHTCPKLEQVCTNGVCGCPVGQTDCNGSCVDTRTSQNHCGMCNRGCPPSTEICSAGACECAAGLTRCPAGNCVNLLTDKLNCSACGMSCPGNRTCNNGSCG